MAWQIGVPGLAPAVASASAPPKLAIRLDSAIAYAAASAIMRRPIGRSPKSVRTAPSPDPDNYRAMIMLTIIKRLDQGPNFGAEPSDAPTLQSTPCDRDVDRAISIGWRQQGGRRALGALRGRRNIPRQNICLRWSKKLRFAFPLRLISSLDIEKGCSGTLKRASAGKRMLDCK